MFTGDPLMNTRLKVLLVTALAFAVLFAVAIGKLIVGGTVAGPDMALPWLWASVPFGFVLGLLVACDMLRAAVGLEPCFL
jgi:Na+-transporting NADH:ubiquinone oxidoreductase subunit NqrB